MAFVTATGKKYTPTAHGFKGTPRQRVRRRTKEAAGPYRSQSSVPSIRAQATRREHRPTPVAGRLRGVIMHPGTVSTGPSLSDVLGAISTVASASKGVAPAPAPLESAEHLGKEQIDAWLKRVKKHGMDTNLPGVGKHSALNAAFQTAQIATGGEAAAEASAASKIAKAISESNKLASEAGAASKLARTGIARRLAQGTERLPKSVRTTGRVAGRGVALPVRHPFTAPLAAQVPSAAIHGDPKEFLKALEGHGTFAKVSGDIAGAIGSVAPGGEFAKHLIEEGVNLPAVVLPSAFLTGKAAVNAAQGNPGEINALLKQWKETGVLPALAEGNGSAALSALKNRPLYSALEALGAANAVGRGAGAAARAASHDRVGGLSRPDLPVRGTNIRIKRRYSRDLIRQLGQRAYDRTGRGSSVAPDTLRGRHYLKEAANRFEAGSEAIRKGSNQRDLEALKAILPKKRFGRLDRKSAEVVNLAVERIARHPETFHADLHHYKQMLEATAKELRPDGKPVLDKAQMAANRALVKQIDAGLKLDHGRIKGTVDAANAFVALQKPILEEMVALKLISPDQAAKAAATGFARVHMGAGHGVPENFIRDLEGVHARTRENFKGEARAAVSGHREAVTQAERQLSIARGGYAQAERSLSTLRANLRNLQRQENRGGVAVASKAQERLAANVKRAEETVQNAKQRVALAERDATQSKATLDAEVQRLHQVRGEKLKPIEDAIRKAKADGAVMLDKHGYPLTLEQITAEMQRQGVGPAGFLSHRTPSVGDFYQPGFGGALMPKGVRTGEAVAKGLQLGGVEALVRQLHRSRGLVHRAEQWNKAIDRFGIVVPGVKTFKDAQRVLRDPARYGLDPAIEPIPVPRYPFMAKQNEILGALEHQDPSIAGDLASGVLFDALDAAQKGSLSPDTRVAFFPGKVVEQLKAGVQPAGPGLRGAQAATTLFTRTVLPFSPGWYIGNGLDNAIRTALAGINPAHFLIGSKVRKELTPAQVDELLAGAHYSSVSALNPHRSVDSLVRGYDPLSKGIRSAADWGQRHGWQQAVVKFGPKMLGAASNYLIAVNKYITEDLPQHGALGKLALAEFRATQGSWTKALTHQHELAAEFAKGVRNPDKLIQFQKDLEEIYGNYTRMSPAARKVLRNVSPFWTWFRAAYRFAFLTMPAHRSISTGFLTAMAQATEPQREAYGLDKMGERPLSSFMQGAIPLPGGGVFPAASYSSFGYAANPVEAVNKLAFPQYRPIFEALSGRDWKGEELPGGEGGKVLGAFWALATAFVPGAPLFAGESEGKKVLGPHLPKLPHSYPPDYVEYKREPTKQITVPAGGGSSSSSSGLGSFTKSYAAGLEGGSGLGDFTKNYMKALEP